MSADSTRGRATLAYRPGRTPPAERSPDRHPPPSLPGPQRGGRAAKLVAVGLLVGVLTAGLWLLRWQQPDGDVTGDSFHYARVAYGYAGLEAGPARAAAARWYCGRQTSDRQVSADPATCRQRLTTGSGDPRYPRIFDSRPGYPLALAPLLRLLGPAGIGLGTLLIGVLAGLLMYGAARDLGGSPTTGVAAVGTLYLLPTGGWLTMMLPEGAMLAGLIATLAGATRLLAGRRGGAALVAAGLAWTYLTKSANGAALALALLAVAVPLLVLAPAARRRLFRLVVAVLAVSAAWFALSWTAGFATLDDTLQDLATWHFRGPDVADPWSVLWNRNLDAWPPYLRGLLTDPGWLVLLLVAAVGLGRKSRQAAALWLAAGLSGVVVAAAHPSLSNFPRFLIPVWIPVALGLALLLPVRRSAGAHAAPRVPAAADSSRAVAQGRPAAAFARAGR